MIGKLNRKTPCWICGLPIYPRRAECEHVLPILDAAIYLQIYNDSLKGSINKYLEVEYGWAHTICNQEKSNISAITAPRNDFIIDENKILKILNKIYRSIRAGSKDLRKMILQEYGSEKEFLRKRFTIMKQKYQDIVNLIAPKELKGAAALIKLASVTKLDNREIYNPAVQDYLFSVNSPPMNAAEGLLGLQGIPEGNESKND